MLTLSEQFQAPVEKSLKEEQSMSIAHKYMTAHYPVKLHTLQWQLAGLNNLYDSRLPSWWNDAVMQILSTMRIKWQPTHIEGRTALLSSYSCKCIAVRVCPTEFLLFFCILKHMINKSGLITTLQYKIARLCYLKTLNPRKLLCLLQWDIINYECLLSSMFYY